MERSAGVIMHIASLPGKFGIGTFGKEAYEYVEFLFKSGLKYWQILPLGQTGYGDSPYQLLYTSYCSSSKACQGSSPISSQVTPYGAPPEVYPAI